MSHQFGLNQTDQSDVFFQEDEAEADAIEYTPPNVDGEIVVLPWFFSLQIWTLQMTAVVLVHTSETHGLFLDSYLKH